MSRLFVFTFLTLSLNLGVATAQSAIVKEETQLIDTYDYRDPDPVPILADNPKLVPYHKFYGYDQVSQKKEWKVVTLENDYIKVFILPEIGGKIWGAIEKSTGEEFLYKNEVVKFRNIALRGPWVSGGLEFNFGTIGHSPDTAAPLDYMTRENKDGSVSCIVGSLDLHSRTNWSVEVRLEPDKAYVETKTFWYNGTPLNQSYYNWMTAAAAVADDLEFIYPGDQYLKHSGEVHAWPVDSLGRNTAMYKNNNFGPAKSKHVVGEYQDFFGGYYHDKKFGFGHWAPYEEMPGQKLWLWSLSRFGGIWEDLLTDTDGQYMEYQAGRLFNQYFPGALNPISQAHFDPNVMDRWRELWFPYKEIGGMVDASEHGVLNVTDENGNVRVAINALQQLDHTLEIKIDGKQVLEKILNLGPMEIFSKSFPGKAANTQVRIKNTELDYSGDSERYAIKRPFEHDPNIELSKVEQHYTNGWEAMKYRDYDQAHDQFIQVLQIDPYHQDALIKLAELEFRRAAHEKALQYANTVLKIDTYMPGANYFAGLAYRALGDAINALESLGWAARDIEYRTAAFGQMAEICLADNNYDRAIMYAQKALDFNRFNLNARYVLALAAKATNDTKSHSDQIDAILNIDPLNHFGQVERAYTESSGAFKNRLKSIENEFPEETVLELALRYHSLGRSETAIDLLSARSQTVKNKLWLAYLLRNVDSAKSGTLLDEVVNSSIRLVFPYRRETVAALEWAIKKTDGWKLDYYLAQNYLAVGRQNEGKELLKKVGQMPDSDIFYRFRAEILDECPYDERLQDYEKALKLNRKDWRVWEEHIQFFLNHKKYEEAHGLSRMAYKRYPDNYTIGLSHAKALVNTGRYAETLKVLKSIRILPYEHARESREVFERAHLVLALKSYKKGNNNQAIELLNRSKEWPENIGVGKPYDPDERMQDYLLAMSYEGLGENSKKEELLQNIVDYTEDQISNSDVDHVFGLLALKKLGKQDELSSLLIKLEKENTKNQMALLLFKNDIEEASALKQKNRISEDIWEVLLTTLQY